MRKIFYDEKNFCAANVTNLIISQFENLKRKIATEL